MMIFILLGGVFVVTGIVLLILQYWLRQICTVQTQGIVSDIIAFKSTETDLGYDHKRTYSHTTYAPVFTYYAEGRKIVKRSSIKSGLRFEIGSAVTLFYSPENVERYYVLEDKLTKYAGFLFAIVGVIFTTVGIIVFIR